MVAKSTKAVQVSYTVKLQHQHLTLQDITPVERIFHGVTTIMFALRDAPAVACDNQLAAIKALRQAIQRWAHPTLLLSKAEQVTPPLPTPRQLRSVLRTMHHHATVQPHASLPRVVIQTPNKIL